MVAGNAPENESPAAAFLHFLLIFYLFFIGERASFDLFRLELLADLAPEYADSDLRRDETRPDEEEEAYRRRCLFHASRLVIMPIKVYRRR